MSNGKGDFHQKVLLLILGVIVGAVPSLYITTMQLRYQDRQVLQEKELTVVHDLATSLNRGGRVAAEFSHLRETLPDQPTRRELDGWLRQHDQVDPDYANWVADMRTQSVVIESVFGANWASPKFPQFPKEIQPDKIVSVKESRKHVEEQKQDLQEMANTLVDLINTEQEGLNKVAKVLSSTL